ncbi:iron-sulfur transferase [Aureococcus anophagefferens]|uniref:Iron-sulfur transferase n=1 Tax=Aureococcus anophagefferens TaxID=44056 RepID=A0ABR1G2I9_AURAN
MDKNDPSVGTGLVGAPACGDVMKLQIKIDDDGNIVDAKFKAFGLRLGAPRRVRSGAGGMRPRGAARAPTRSNGPRS